MLCAWVKKMKDSLKKVLVVQGEEKPALALAQQIKDHLGIPAEAPEMGQVISL